jgi:hypothetical protein
VACWNYARWILSIWRTSKLIRGDESAENQTGTSSPSDGASCSESLVDVDSWKSDPAKVKNANLAVEYVNCMRSKYAEALNHPEDSDDRLRIFNEGKEYLGKLGALTQAENASVQHLPD